MKLQDLTKCDLEQCDRLKLWKSRPWRHKLEHRWNVVRAFFLGQIAWSTALRGLRFPHESAYLGVCFSTQFVLVVCPAFLQQVEHAMRERFLHIPAQKSDVSSINSTTYSANCPIKKASNTSAKVGQTGGR